VLTLEDLHVAHYAREQKLVPPDVLSQHLTRLDLAPGTPGLAPTLLDAKLLDTEAARHLVTKARRKVGLEADQAYTKVALEGRDLDDEVLEKLLTQTLVGGRIGSKLVAQGLITAAEDAQIIVKARELLQEKERELLEKERANDFREAPPGPEGDGEPTDRVKTSAPSPAEEERLLAEPTVRVQKAPLLTPSGEARVLVEPTVTIRPAERTESDIMREGTERLKASELPYTVGGNAEDTEKHSAVLPLPRPDVNETQKHYSVLPLPEAPGSTTKTDQKKKEAPSLEGKTLKVLSGYEIEKELGRGAMGVVYAAREATLKRQVALKVLAPGGDQEAQKRFMREARAIAALDHPGIVPVYQYGEAEGHFFIAMKLIDGRPLRQLAAKPMAAKRAAAILEQVARAMAYAHEHGVIHRDLKPANILVEAGDKAWVVDFGIAKLDTEATLTSAGEIMGTPAYMSPEQALQLPLQPSTDVYSLGAVLYMITTGQPPFPGQNAVEVLPRVASDDPPRPSKLRPDIPADLETIILVAMMKEPERRYLSALAMAEDLRAFQAGEPIAGKRPSPTYLARRWAKRHALPLLAATVVLVAAVGLLSVRNVKAEHTALVQRQTEETEARLAQKLDELQRVYDEAAAHTRRTPDEERASAEKMRALLGDAAALSSNGNVAKWTRAVSDFLAGRAKEKREDARRFLLVGKREEAKTAAFLAAALDPTSPENATLQANMNRAAVVTVKLTTPVGVNWVKLDKDLHPTGDWQPPAVSGSDQVVLMANVDALRIRAHEKGRLDLVIDIEAARIGERADPTLTLPALPRETAKTVGMVFVAPWAYVVGGRAKGTTRDNVAQIDVEAPGFLIDRTACTRRAFLAFVNDKGYTRDDLWSEKGKLWLAERRAAGPLEGPKDCDLGAEGRGDEPVTGVSFYEAEAFARWAGKALPTQDQLEVASRGALGGTFPWGKRFANELFQPGLETPRPVGTFALDTSPIGCADLAGNVREWTRDEKKTWATEQSGRRLMLVKGAAFSDSESETLQLAKGAACSERDPRERVPDVGFRCVRPLRAEDF